MCEKGTLYLVPTPIGNLADMTYRAVEVLSGVDLIAAEDTRHTRKLLSHYDIHTPMISYHEHNKEQAGGEILEKLLAGQSVACVSDAGMPGIADPGEQIAAMAIEADIPVVPLPGANAGLTALIASGLDASRFRFVGFLPRTKERAREVLQAVLRGSETMIFYEAPHRLKKTLSHIKEVMGGGRHAVLARELTKRYEEFRRGTLEELLRGIEEKEPRGEYVILVEGGEGAQDDPSAAPVDADPAAMVERLAADGMDKKSAMKEAARAFRISRRDVYRLCLEKEA
ncbi:16S rRNA (cytidine(1402)-2'-O)-methyltransferase [Selenomonas sp. TAMA-11512]|uniref:16S rRNA (cytidine(1402)-2'-O)-methyltransferase n=1 Tax=Selenomonas sp. TAMA-11512 TaxID=3095337 RepID=UPI00308DE16F|nr:16S rRNA (cytidine(1402)-2'-O)-methyltransferase [Selenomonas sp. TAMA-11512]